MSKTSQTSTVEEAEILEKHELAKIKPMKLPLDNENDDLTERRSDNQLHSKEQSLVTSIRMFLRAHGVRKSAAALRDAVETPHDVFGPEQAVSALSSLGFKSSFGSIKLERLTDDFFPLVAFKRDGNSVIVNGPAANGLISVTEPVSYTHLTLPTKA